MTVHRYHSKEGFSVSVDATPLQVVKKLKHDKIEPDTLSEGMYAVTPRQLNYDLLRYTLIVKRSGAGRIIRAEAQDKKGIKFNSREYDLNEKNTFYIIDETYTHARSGNQRRRVYEVFEYIPGQSPQE